MESKFPQSGSSQEKNWAKFLLTFLLLFWAVYLGKVLFFDRPGPSLKKEPPIGLNSAASTPPMTSASKVTLSGSIIPLIEGTASPGTHRLVDSEGKVLAILKSRNLDLNFTITGVSVEITGKKERTLENNLPLINVESLRYRSTK